MLQQVRDLVDLEAAQLVPAQQPGGIEPAESRRQLCAAWTREAVDALLAGLEDGDVTVSAAAADVLMDTFSEDDAPLHELFVASGAAGRIAAAHAAMRAKIRDAREKEAMGREAAAHVKEVLLNTGRFLKYKASFASR